MRTLALHTLGSYTAGYSAARSHQTRETTNRPTLRNTPLSAFQTLSIDIRRISGA